MSGPIKKALLLGGSHIAWWAAVFLKKNLPQLDVVIIDNQQGLPAVETSGESFSFLLKLIGLTEAHLLANADGHFCLAQAYFNWSSSKTCFNSADEYDFPWEAVDFNQWLAKLKLSGLPVNVDDYSISALACHYGKYVQAKKNTASLSFDAAAFRKLLIQYAAQLKVEVIADNISNFQLGDDGKITSIQTANGAIITADFFIDADVGGTTGTGGLDNAYVSWEKYLPANRKWSMVHSLTAINLQLFTGVQLMSAGWIKSVPLKQKAATHFIFRDESISKIPDDIKRAFEGASEEGFNTGVLSKIWDKNCLRVGPAAITMDNFSHSPFYLAAITLKRFVDFWPSTDATQASADEFNRLMHIDCAAVRDFHCVHYLLANKALAEVDWLRHIEVPDTLRHRLELFKHCGRNPMDEATQISSPRWMSLLLGFDYWPTSYDCLAKYQPLELFQKYSNDIKFTLGKQVERLPIYGDFLNKQIGY